MSKTTNFSFWTYLLFPGLAMLLGWGLRGYIGGGPFGAMIPGVMVALAISMLLGFRAGFTALVAVFGAIGIGLGGEMTYGQTLAFLKDPETVWWGSLATTLKGAIWGICGGAVLGLGLIQNRIPNKTIIISYVFLIIGLFIGVKLINEPQLIYFSDPVNNPRPESWAGLLFGALVFMAYLRLKVNDDNFRIVMRFAKWGLISGGLGFGLGGCWKVFGSYFPDAIFNDWWKAMEFTFGLLFGLGIGYAAWLSRNEFDDEKEISHQKTELVFWKEMLFIFIISSVAYLLYPVIIKQLMLSLRYNDGMLSMILDIFSNYAFYGFVIFSIIFYRKGLAWQIVITFVVCHTFIDLMRDIRPQPDVAVNPWIQLIVVVITTMVVAFLVAKYRRAMNVTNSMFQVLVWATVIVAFVGGGFRLFFVGGPKETGLLYLIFRESFVHIVFLTSAIYVSRKSVLINKS